MSPARLTALFLLSYGLLALLHALSGEHLALAEQAYNPLTCKKNCLAELRVECVGDCVEYCNMPVKSSEAGTEQYICSEDCRKAGVARCIAQKGKPYAAECGYIYKLGTDNRKYEDETYSACEKRCGWITQPNCTPLKPDYKVHVKERNTCIHYCDQGTINWHIRACEQLCAPSKYGNTPGSKEPAHAR